MSYYQTLTEQVSFHSKGKISIMSCHENDSVYYFYLQGDQSSLNALKNKDITVGSTPVQIADNMLIVTKANPEPIRYEKRFGTKTIRLPFFLGHDVVTLEPVITDLRKAPHVLIAGTSGFGKSKHNHMTFSNLIQARIDGRVKNLEIVGIDPKRVDFKVYSKLDFFHHIPHTNMILDTLETLLLEMEERYQILSDNDVTEIEEYNALKDVQPIPYTVIVMDELTPLLSLGSKAIDLITLLVSQSRAVGMHFILSTQYPNAGKLTNDIRINCGSRICFSVPSGPESKSILDQYGAERLTRQGACMVKYENRTRLLQAPLIDSHTTKSIVIEAESLGLGAYGKCLDFNKEREVPTRTNVNNLGRGMVEGVDEETLNAVTLITSSNTRKVNTSKLSSLLNVGPKPAKRIFHKLINEGHVIDQPNGTVLFPVNPQLFEDYQTRQMEVN